VAQLYPWALGSIYVASYDLLGYSDGILTGLHTGAHIRSCKARNICEEMGTERELWDISFRHVTEHCSVDRVNHVAW
jgi:hypothetical protein